jgi:hypothetical protein
MIGVVDVEAACRDLQDLGEELGVGTALVEIVLPYCPERK